MILVSNLFTASGVLLRLDTVWELAGLVCLRTKISESWIYAPILSGIVHEIDRLYT